MDINTDECSICLMKMKQEVNCCTDDHTKSGLIVKLQNCGHHFHENCITTAMNTGNSTCPLCRKEYQRINIQYDTYSKEEESLFSLSPLCPFTGLVIAKQIPKYITKNTTVIRHPTNLYSIIYSINNINITKYAVMLSLINSTRGGQIVLPFSSIKQIKLNTVKYKDQGITSIELYHKEPFTIRLVSLLINNKINQISKIFTTMSESLSALNDYENVFNV